MSVDLRNGFGPRLASRLCHNMVGFLAAAYVVVGRWSPARLVGSEDSILIVEPRLWLVVGLLVLALVPIRDQRNVVLPDDRRWPIGRGALLMLALLIYMLASALWAPEAQSAVLKAYELALAMVATFSVYRLLQKIDAAAVVRGFWLWMLILTGLLALAAAPSAGAGGRLAVLAGGPNVFGRLMALLYVAAINRLVGSRHLFRWSLVVVAAAVLVLLSGSRGAMVAVAVSSVFFVLVHRATFGKIVVIGMICFSVAVSVFMFTPLGMLMTDAFQARIGARMVDQVYTSGRDVIYAGALKLITEHPAFGVGLGGFCPITGWVYPHNIFLEITCEGGSVGLILFIAMIWAFGSVIWRKRSRIDITSLTALIMLAVASQFSGDLYDSRAIFLLLMFVVFAHDGAQSVAPNKAAPESAIPADFKIPDEV